MRYIAFVLRLTLWPIRFITIPLGLVCYIVSALSGPHYKAIWFSCVDAMLNLARSDWEKTKPEWEKIDQPNDNLLRPR